MRERVGALYASVLSSYEASPKIKIIREIRGSAAFKGAKAVLFPEGGSESWEEGWTPSKKRAARGFLYTRRLRSNKVYGFKLISVAKAGGSVIGQEVAEKEGAALFSNFE
jgi:hypothetical protein